MAEIKVLAIDDHPMLTVSMPATLAPHGIVVTTSTNGRDLLTRLENDRPDVLVLDLAIGNERGLDIARQVLAAYPDTCIVVYSQFARDPFIVEAYRVGVLSFVPKNAPIDELVTAIRKASQGQHHYPPEIAQRLAIMKVEGDESPAARLSERDLTVFKYMAEGLSNEEIAAKLGLGVKRIYVIANGIRETLGVQRPADITRLALKYQLIDE